jgi:4-diphosphocytidyl-2-C-methyl-D-erythritol kinase
MSQSPPVSPSPNTARVLAPAKLNLFLEVLGKRSDGYHELDTVMTTVDLHDEVVAARRDDGRLTLHVSDARTRRGDSPVAAATPIPDGPDNLVLRAAELLRRHCDVAPGADIHLIKRIPLQAGLAGGSTDAAAVLRVLNTVWKLGLPQSQLRELSARLGSDIPFFLGGGVTAVCRGRGERVEPVPAPSGLAFVVVKPASGLSTPDVFQTWSKSNEAKRTVDVASSRPFVSALLRGEFAAAARQMRNALQPPALELNADVARLHHEFNRLPVLAHQLSGSGTSYFGWCWNREQAQCVAGRLAGRGLGDVYVLQSRSAF